MRGGSFASRWPFGIGRLALVATMVLAGGACNDSALTEADCVVVKARLERAWERDAMAAQRKATTDVFLTFVRDERDRLGSEWMSQCGPLVGQRVSPDELACLQRADTIDDIYECNR